MTIAPASFRIANPTPVIASPELRERMQLRSDVEAALKHPRTTKLTKAPVLPKSATSVDIEFGWGHATKAFKHGDAVFVQKVSQRLGPADEPVGPAKVEWFKLGSVPASLAAALEPKLSPADVLKKIHALPVAQDGYTKDAPKKEDVLAKVSLPSMRPWSFSALILKGDKVVFEKVLTGGFAPAMPGDERYSKPVALPKGFAPKGFDWAQLAFVRKADL